MGSFERFLRVASKFLGVLGTLVLVASLLTPAPGEASGDLHSALAYLGPQVGMFLLLLVPAGWLYCLPSIVAERRRHSMELPIFALNLLLGATFVFWAGALVWALAEDNRDRNEAPAMPVTPGPSRSEAAIRDASQTAGRNAGLALGRFLGRFLGAGAPRA